jgi:hypothetical protein
MIAITVSTNYSDILPLILEANVRFFKKWIFVTSVNDTPTIHLLMGNSNIDILYWDFNNSGRKFDKGGAVKYAQEFAYDKFPDEWYLLLDSDICLSKDFSAVAELTGRFDPEAIYGAKNRYDFNKLSDFRNFTNYSKYPLGHKLYGYFQLYKQKLFYQPSIDAGLCDIEFTGQFNKRFFLDGFECSHLGRKKRNWAGRKIGSDFIMDC